jgi:hypothetical protein
MNNAKPSSQTALNPATQRRCIQERRKKINLVRLAVELNSRNLNEETELFSKIR